MPATAAADSIECCSICCPHTALVAAIVVSFLELPAVEKLQLLELRGMEEQEESGDVEELQRFKELKHQLILLDRAELGSIPQRDKNLNPKLLLSGRR